MENYLPVRKIFIIGVRNNSKECLFREYEEILQDCEHIFLSKHFFEYFSHTEFKDKLILFPEKLSFLPETIRKISENDEKIAILATGDPNFFGITAFIKRNFSEEEVKVYPNVSTMQQAFAKLTLSWEDANFFSLHGRERDKLLGFLLKTNKGFLFTSHSEDVLYVLKLLRDCRLEDYRLFIFENIGDEREKITELTFPYLLKGKPSNLNVVIFLREKPLGEYIGLGLEEERFLSKGGMITKREVRVNIVSLLSLKEGCVLWDVGAGSGSLSIEATFNPMGVISFAIEKDEASFQNIKENIKKFSAYNVKPILSDFLEIKDSLPSPDRVFIGGGKIKDTLHPVMDRLKDGGIVVVAVVSLENLHEVLGFIQRKDLKYDFLQIAVSKKESQKNVDIMKASNPIFLIRLFK